MDFADFMAIYKWELDSYTPKDNPFPKYQPKSLHTWSSFSVNTAKKTDML